MGRLFTVSLKSKSITIKNLIKISTFVVNSTELFFQGSLTMTKIGCCGFFRLFGRVLKVVLPNVSPVSVAGRHLQRTAQRAQSAVL